MTGGATSVSTQASTLESGATQRLWRYFDEGGPDNMAACLAVLASEIGGAAAASPPVPVSAFGCFEGACFDAPPKAARALIVFYRSIYLASDLEPIDALARALRDKGFAVTSVFVTSLKDDAALESLRTFLEERRFDVVLNATAFSARLDAKEGTALDMLDAPVLQVVLAGTGLDVWRASQRGLGPSDLAMHIALPEIDGRIHSRAISFKAAAARNSQNGIRDRRASGARRSRHVRRRAGPPLGKPSPHAAIGQAPRLRVAGLSGARGAHRLCGRPRYARERHRHLRDSCASRGTT